MNTFIKKVVKQIVWQRKSRTDVSMRDQLNQIIT